MTAEIAIMNAQAVALAADSAVTFGSKVKNTANKIFALSKFEPIAAMVYNNADFAGVPWETVIKTFRVSLGQKSFATVKDYVNEFFQYLDADPLIKAATSDPSRLVDFIDVHLVVVRKSVLANVEQEISSAGSITTSRIESIIAEVVDKRQKELEKKDPGIRKAGRRVRTGIIDARIAKNFDQLPLSARIKQALRKLVRYAVRAFPTEAHSGLVIAGFGRDELFPALETHSIHVFADDSVVLKRDSRSAAITADEPVFVIAFAQSEVVATFMDGVDPTYQTLIDFLLRSILREYPGEILKQVASLSAKERARLERIFRTVGGTVAEQYMRRLTHIRAGAFSGPITSVVQSLPKDELAAMAESLVNLTSFKRKVSLDLETVGGPIDVAVISKGDGLVWIKRKHYFEPRYNPQFFDLYYWREKHGYPENDNGKQEP